MFHQYYGNDGFDPLTRLKCLTRLGIVEPDGFFPACLPACLSRLTTLRAFILDDPTVEWLPVGGNDALLSQALPHLSHLTRLDIDGFLDLPPTLTALNQLQSFCWLSKGGWSIHNDAQLPPGQSAQLPPGQWLGRLHCLAANCKLLSNSLPMLTASANQINELCIVDAFENDKVPLAIRILSWAVQLPSLRSLILTSANLPAVLTDALLEIQRQCPHINIRTKETPNVITLDPF